MSELDNFIASYTGDSCRIRFAWNGQHAEAFEDANKAFRAAVLTRILEQPDSTPISLLRDIFTAETAWAGEAWCVDGRLHYLADLLLTRGRESVVDDFLLGRMVSFDIYCACNRIAIEPDLARQLRDGLAQRLNVETDTSTRDILQEGYKFFTDYLARRTP